MTHSTSFDQMVKELGLAPEEYERSQPLKEWAKRNREEKYVPSDLLKAWGFSSEDEAA